MTGHEAAKRPVGRLLAAIESRDLRRVAAALHPDATWQNVPHGTVNGRLAIVEMLAPIITWSDRVRWDIVSKSFGREVAWLERADRFWIDGDEYTVRCNGVVTTDGDVVRSVRDYSDLGEWRARIAPVYARLAERAPREVVQRHLDAVASLDPVAMTADYALDAVLERSGNRCIGHTAIADYFDTVPARVGAASVTFGDVDASDNAVAVQWQIGDNEAVQASGRDHYVVEHGRIVHQTVTLVGPDF